MSENINFIPVTELPVAEGDNVNVLCTENGELKQKPANGLGGASDYDLVLKVVQVYDEDDNYVEDESSITIVSGSDTNVAEKVSNGEVPKIKALYTFRSFFFENDRTTQRVDVYACNLEAFISTLADSGESLLYLNGSSFLLKCVLGTNVFEFD